MLVGETGPGSGEFVTCTYTCVRMSLCRISAVQIGNQDLIHLGGGGTGHSLPLIESYRAQNTIECTYGRSRVTPRIGLIGHHMHSILHRHYKVSLGIALTLCLHIIIIVLYRQMAGGGFLHKDPSLFCALHTPSPPPRIQSSADLCTLTYVQYVAKNSLRYFASQIPKVRE